VNGLNDSCFKVCDCGAKNPHVYFYPIPDFEPLKFPIPFGSVEAGMALIEIYTVSGDISEEKKDEFCAYLRETAKLPEKAEGDELMLVEAIREAQEDILADTKTIFE
jgi:hypothetical protein